MTNGQQPPPWMQQRPQQRQRPQQPQQRPVQGQRPPQQQQWRQQPMQQRPPQGPPGMQQQPPGLPRPGINQGKLPSVKKKKMLRILVALLALSGIAVIVSAVFFFMYYV